MRFHLYQIEGWHSWITFVLGREAIGDAFHEMVGTELFGIHIHISEDAVGTKVVESPYMVVVLVGDEHGIKGREVDAQHLFAEIRATVDENALAPHLHKAGTAQSFVFRVLGSAHLAGAPYLGHSTRGSAAKYRDFHIRFTSGWMSMPNLS